MRLISCGSNFLISVVSLLLILILLAPSMSNASHSYLMETPAADSTSPSVLSSPIVQIPLKNQSQPLGITVGPNHNVWFAENNSTAIVEYDPSNQSFKNFPVPINTTSMIWFMVFDSGGNLWFSNQLQNYLWRLSPSTGKFANFTTGDQFVRPFGLAYDNTSNKVWFTSTYTDQIGYFNIKGEDASMGALINVTGTPTYTIPPLFGPTGIQIGPQGNIFVSEPFSANIVEYSPTQQRFINVWKLPQGSQPVGIAVDSAQGTIWFANHASSLFGYVNTSTGKVTEFATSPFEYFGDTISLPYWARISSNGVVWIDEHASNKIARYDPATGMLTEFAIPTNRSAPLHLMIDNQRQVIWFTEFFGSNLGEIDDNASCQCIVQLSSRNLTMQSNTLTFYLKYIGPVNKILTPDSPAPLISGTFQIDGSLAQNLSSITSVINSTDYKITLTRGPDLMIGNYTITVCPRLTSSDNITSPGPIRQCATAALSVENSHSAGHMYLLYAVAVAVATTIIATISLIIARRYRN